MVDDARSLVPGRRDRGVNQLGLAVRNRAAHIGLAQRMALTVDVEAQPREPAVADRELDRTDLHLCLRERRGLSDAGAGRGHRADLPVERIDDAEREWDV